MKDTFFLFLSRFTHVPTRIKCIFYIAFSINEPLSLLTRSCKGEDAHLVTITTKEKIEWLGQYIEGLEGGRNENNEVQNSIWHTSGHLDRSVNEFYWRDGTGIKSAALIIVFSGYLCPTVFLP